MTSINGLADLNQRLLILSQLCLQLAKETHLNVIARKKQQKFLNWFKKSFSDCWKIWGKPKNDCITLSLYRIL